MNGHKSRVSLAGPGKQLTSLIKRKMKKLNLEKLNLAAEDVLQRNQLSGIYGGSGGSSNCENSYCDANIVCCEPFFYLCSGPIGTCKRR
jgi:hypothetical protein